MALPGDAAVGGDHTPQHTAVDEEHHHAQQDLPDVAVEQSANQYVGEPAEDDARGTDRDHIRRREEPDAETGHNPHDECGDDEPLGHQNQEAEHHPGNRVGQQVFPPIVQERREHDARETVRLARLDARAVQVMIAHRVDRLDDVQQGGQRDDDHRGPQPQRPGGSLGLGGPGWRESATGTAVRAE